MIHHERRLIVLLAKKKTVDILKWKKERQKERDIQTDGKKENKKGRLTTRRYIIFCAVTCSRVKTTRGWHKQYSVLNIQRNWHGREKESNMLHAAKMNDEKLLEKDSIQISLYLSEVLADIGVTDEIIEGRSFRLTLLWDFAFLFMCVGVCTRVCCVCARPPCFVCYIIPILMNVQI